MKNLKIFVLTLACLAVFGCASLKDAINGVTPEQNTQMSQQIAATAGPFIPAPYQLPATAFLGWIACVGYNWFKKKTEKADA